MGVGQRVQRADAVTLHVQQLATGRCHHAPTHHQQAVLVTGNEFFDDDAAPAFAVRQLVGGAHIGFGTQIERNAAPVVAIVGFDHHRHAHALGRLPGGIGALHQLALGHRHATGLEQGLGQVFVTGDFFGNGAGLVGFGRPDAPLGDTVAQLHQIAIGQAHVRDTPGGRRVHNVRRARAQAQRVDHVGQFGDGCGHVERAVVDGRLQQVAPQVQGAAPYVFLAGAKSDFVDAGFGGLARFAKAGAHAAQVLQLQADVLQDVGGPGALLQALQKAAAHARAAFVLNQAGQPSRQAFVQTVDGIGGEVFKRTNVDPGLNHRPISPDIGAAQVGHPQNIDFFLARHAWGWPLKSTGLVRRALCILADCARAAGPAKRR